jgi:hypothetical protein
MPYQQSHTTKSIAGASDGPWRWLFGTSVVTVSVGFREGANENWGFAAVSGSSLVLLNPTWKVTNIDNRYLSLACEK